MLIKNPHKDESTYENKVEKQFIDAMRCLKMLRPDEINDKLQYYAGLHLALLELKRLALNEPKIYASLNK